MPRRCPKLGSNVATSSPARCSGKFPKGRARGNHARAGRPCRCRVPASLSRRLAPCASNTECPSGPRLLSRLSIAPLTPCLSLRSAPRRAAAMGVAAELAAAASSLSPGFPRVRHCLLSHAPLPLQPLSVHRSRRIAPSPERLLRLALERVAALPQAIAEQAVATSRCARARWHFTATSPPLEGRHRQATVSSTPVPPAAVAKPSRATSRPSKTTSECGRTPWCSSSTSPPPLSLLRPDSASPDDLPVQNPVRDLALKFD